MRLSVTESKTSRIHPLEKKLVDSFEGRFIYMHHHIACICVVQLLQWEDYFVFCCCCCCRLLCSGFD